jgi:Rnk N-terminus
MKQHNIFVTEEDMERLRHLLDPAGRRLSRDQEHLEMLEAFTSKPHACSRFDGTYF